MPGMVSTSTPLDSAVLNAYHRARPSRATNDGYRRGLASTEASSYSQCQTRAIQVSLKCLTRVIHVDLNMTCVEHAIVEASELREPYGPNVQMEAGVLAFSGAVTCYCSVV